MSSLLQSLLGGQPPQSPLTRCFSGLRICLGMRVGSLQGRWQKSFGGLPLKSRGPTARSSLHSPPPPPPGALLPALGSPWPCGCLRTSVLLPVVPPTQFLPPPAGAVQWSEPLVRVRGPWGGHLHPFPSRVTARKECHLSESESSSLG